MEVNMNKRKLISIIIIILLLGSTVTGCGGLNMGVQRTYEETVIIGEEVPVANAPETLKFLVPTASGITVYKGTNVVLEASNSSQGYVMIKYSGKNQKIKVQITKSQGTTYTYNLNARNIYEVFPLTDGDGYYSIKIFENISGTKYSQLFSKSITVKLTNQFLPFLYPNQYVNFNSDSLTVIKGTELTKNVTDDLKKVELVYNYVIKNFTYDKEKAATVKSGYLPDVDNILSIKKGICFDYAAVMATMLRSQNIPCKLVIGYTGNMYHAWINVYSEKTGWIDGMIFFDGSKWQLMDPTFASSSKQSSAIMKYIGTGSNYTSKYTY
jgi:transglutaminase-like putative cysteine protease